MLTGYEDRRTKSAFLAMWEDGWKQVYKDNSKLSSFTWADRVEDEYTMREGYFKLIEGTSGKLFNPQQMSAFNTHFYWGYVHQLDLDNLNVLEKVIVGDFKNLLDAFVPGLEHKRAKKRRKG